MIIRRKVPDGIQVKSKVTVSRLAALVFALLVSGGICVAFGAIAYFGIQELFVNGGAGWEGGGIAAVAFVGLALARQVLELEPLRSASGDELVKVLDPTFQRYLTGPLN